MADRLLRRGISSERVRVIHNWCDDENVRPTSPMENPLRRQWGLEGKFVVGYSGNLGRAHEFMTVLSASEKLKTNPNIIFVLIGGGHHFDAFARCVKERGLEQKYRFFPYQDQKLLSYSLCVSDVHWISLRPELEGLIVPSKFYGIAAAGRPIIAITAKDGEIARLIEKHACGVIVEPGNGEALADAIMKLFNGQESRVSMRVRARSMLDGEFNRQSAFQQWRNALEPFLIGCSAAEQPNGVSAS
jgi:glycosyltransferase involved in cell wall biosynthesis